MQLHTLRRLFGYPVIVYGLLGLLILGPLLHSGYVLTLDMVFTPVLRMPASVNSSYLFYTALHWLNLLLPADWLQKTMLLGIFVLAGWGMHRLLAQIDEHAYILKPAFYVAGLFYAVNPFTYDRFMAGQYAVLLGYALLPWFVRSVLRFVALPGWQGVTAISTWASIIAVVSIHSIVPILLLSALIVSWRLWRLRYMRTPAAAYRRLLGYSALSGLFWIAASSYWLVPLLLGRSATAQTIDSFTTADRQAFATIGSTTLERLGNVFSLQGFWGERYHLFTLPEVYTPGWLWLMLVLLAVISGGFAVMWRQRLRGVMVVFSTTVMLGGVLAADIGNGWLAGHLPLFAGYREPQKLAMLVALGFGVTLAFGVSGLVRSVRIQARLPLTVPILWATLFLLPALVASPLFWGGHGQLRAVQYPAGWYAANQDLNRDHGNFQTVFLPWHLYINADFAGRTIANPAVNFFDRPVIISDDPELSNVAPAKPTNAKQQIANALKTAPRSNAQLGQNLAKLRVKYILLATTSDYRLYGYLNRQSNISLVANHGTLLVYRNNAYRE